MAESLVHLIASPTLIVIGFGLYPKLKIEPATVLEAWPVVVVVVGLAMVIVGLAVVVVVGLAVVVVGWVVGVPPALVESGAFDVEVVVDPLVVLVVLSEIEGLVGGLVDEGSAAPTGGSPVVVVESAKAVVVVVVVACPDGDPHAAITTDTTATEQSHFTRIACLSYGFWSLRIVNLGLLGIRLWPHEQRGNSVGSKFADLGFSMDGGHGSKVARTRPRSVPEHQLFQ